MTTPLSEAKVDLSRGACRDHPEVEFVLDYVRLKKSPLELLHENKEALSLCRVCPVRVECGNFYTENPPDWITIAGGKVFGTRGQIVDVPLWILDPDMKGKIKTRRQQKRYQRAVN